MFYFKGFSGLLRVVLLTALKWHTLMKHFMWCRALLRGKSESKSMLAMTLVLWIVADLADTPLVRQPQFDISARCEGDCRKQTLHHDDVEKEE